MGTIDFYLGARMKGAYEYLGFGTKLKSILAGSILKKALYSLCWTSGSFPVIPDEQETTTFW